MIPRSFSVATIVTLLSRGVSNSPSYQNHSTGQVACQVIFFLT
uniref:Uncharacterized protein n=1 Tax=Siphoviridae sp. ctP6113 TaxID=2826318 RepID=A0A8S5MUZ8_9CAUD|nr:MAG TPA: hypothetical protein [Siphoviridae sp. ctP6113]